MKSLDKQKPKELDWEKEFDEKYQEVIGDLIDSAIDVGSKTDNNPLVIDLNPIRLLTPEFIEARTKLEQFIKQTLTQQRTELLEEIEEVFCDWCGDSQYITGSWNSGEELDSDRKGDEYWDWWSKTAWEQLKEKLLNLLK